MMVERKKIRKGLVRKSLTNAAADDDNLDDNINNNDDDGQKDLKYEVDRYDDNNDVGNEDEHTVFFFSLSFCFSLHISFKESRCSTNQSHYLCHCC
jgi:hypothetical protein